MNASSTVQVGNRKTFHASHAVATTVSPTSARMRFTAPKHTDKLPRVGRRGQVLIVDDEPGLREMLSILFRREGYDVTASPGFTAAKEVLENAPTPYGVVLTDLMMPDGSGLDVLSLAKQRSDVTEVIVMTAHGALDNAVEAMKRGAYDFVTKPFATPELRALVAKAFEKRALATENVRLRAQVER